MSRHPMRWVLSAFDRRTDAQVRRIELPEVDVPAARLAFGLPADDPMYDSYLVTSAQVPFLRRYTQEPLDLDEHDWFLDGYAASGGG